MLKKLFTHDLYIKVSKNKFEAKNLSMNGTWESNYPNSPFTTNRLLIGTFSAAEPALTQLVKRILPTGFFAKRPQMVIHPTDMVEGGLSEVEERIFKELGLGSGAFKVVVHIGAELSDEQAIKLLCDH
jgi:rod shape-determining protein MreB and related proteins